MAVNLKTKKKCHIVAPSWLNVGKVTYLFLFASYSPSSDHLQDRLNRETSEPGFSDLPFHFTEVSKVLLDVYVTSAPRTRTRLTFCISVLQTTWKILTSCVHC